MNLSIKRRLARLYLWPLILVFVIAGCSSLANLSAPTATTPADNDGEPTPETTAVATNNVAAPVTLNLWLPMAFDPSSDQLAASLLQDRLDAFSDEHPSVRVDVRLKADSGTGGMLESLLAAQDAAPLALPDLVLLHSNLLPPVVEAGMLEPVDVALGNDWFSFAGEMVSWGGQLYAWPFVGDALVIAYRPTAVNETPASWLDSLDQQSTLAFAAADPTALFLTSQLLTLGVDLDELSGDALLELYTFFAQGQALSIFPFWLNQFENPEQSWQAFTEGRAPMVVAWSNRVLSSSNTGGYQAAPLVTASGEPYTLSQGWSWVGTTALSERAELVAELAAFLSDPEFMSQWSAAAGYLPARSSALDAWTPDQRQVLARQIVGNAHNAPSPLAYPDIGPALSDAIVALLKQEITPEDAVARTLEQLSGP